MCTIVIAVGLQAELPVLLAANRDELLARPWQPPRANGARPWIVSPRDELAGGTWIGVTERGVLGAVTNRGRAREPERRSRGLLLADALTAPSAEGAVEAVLTSLGHTPHNACNVLLADPLGAWLVVHGAEGTIVQPLAAGLHVVTSSHDLDPPILAPLLAPLRRAAGLDWPTWVGEARRLLVDHRDFGGHYAVCKHHGPYGTASASLIGLGRHHPSAWLFAPGPPCVTGFRDVELP